MDNSLPDLERLINSAERGNETASSLEFLQSLGAGAAPEPEKPTPAAPAPAKPDPAAGSIKAVKPPKHAVTDDAGAAPDSDTAPPPALDADAAAQTGDQPTIAAGLPDVDDLAAEAPEEGLVAKAGKVGRDLATGLAEIPAQVTGGIADAINNVIGIGDIFQEALPMPGMQIFDDEGNFSPEFLSSSEVTERRKTESGQFLPTTDKADSVSGGMVRQVAKFVSGFALGGRVLGEIGGAGKAAFAGRSTVQGMFSDFASFDGHEQRLSNLVQSVPALANPVTEYLAADPDDSELEGRFKNAVEGLIPDAVFTGLLGGLKAIKRARAAKAATGARTYVAAADAVAAHVKAAGQLPASGSGDVFRAIGDSSPEAPLVRRTIGKLQAARRATEPGVPDDVAAKGVAHAAAPSAGKESVGDTFINFARINTDDDIKAVLSDLAKSQDQAISKAQRGVQTNAQTIAKSAEKYDEVWKGLLNRRPGELPFNAEQQLAMRNLWTASGEKLLETARMAEAQPTMENLLSFRKMLSVHDLVQKQAMAVRTETARALQQWAIPAGSGGRDKIMAMHNILAQHGGMDVNLDLARKFAGLAEEVAQNPANMSKVAKAAEASGATTLKAINELWMGLGLLSGPKTHIRNFISNMGMMATAVGERAVAARAAGLIDERAAVEIGEASAMASAIFSNVRKAWSDAAQTFRTGQMKLGASQLDIPPEMAMRSLDTNTVMGKTMRGLSFAPGTVFKSLQASDQFFKTLNFEGEMAAMAQREAIRAARDGAIPADQTAKFAAEFLSHPPEAAVTTAMEEAARRTFTAPPGKLTRHILSFRNDFPLARFVVPFVNTPANVFRTAIEYSPLAPVLSKYRNAIAKGGADAALARTRLGMGSAAMLATVDMAMDGKITGSGPPEGSAEYEALRRTGWKPYSVKIGGHWVSYRGIDPFSTVFGMGADIGDYTRYSDADPDSVETIMDMMAIGTFAAAENMLDRSFLTGLSSLVEAVNDPKRNAEKFVSNFASSFVPRGLTEIRYATDTTVRDARTLMDSFKAKIPYMSMTVPERRDEWGRVQKMESGWGTAYDVLSPFYSTPLNAEPIDAELLRQGFGTGHAIRAMKQDGVTVSFRNRPDIHNRYLELRGQTRASDLDPKLFRKYGDNTMLDVLNGLVTGDHPLARQYARGSDGEGGEKEGLIDKVVRDFGRAARKRLVEEFPEISATVEEETRKRAARATDGDGLVDQLLGTE